MRCKGTRCAAAAAAAAVAVCADSRKWPPVGLPRCRTQQPLITCMCALLSGLRWRASCDVQHGTRCVSNAACVVQRATCIVCLTHIVVNTAGVASDFQNFELQAAAFAV